MGSQSLIENKEVFYFMDIEIFKDIRNFEGMYQVSNFGNVKSLPRKMTNGNSFFISKERILKINKNTQGYSRVVLWKDGKHKNCSIHQLVAITFLGHEPCGHNLVVDHINDNISDNRLDNLQIITNRENTCKTQGRYSSKYKGVCWHKRDKKWRSEITIKNKKVYLGYFKDEHQAHLAYQNALQNI